MSGRIGLLGPEDEVGRLARTFDSMLARLEEAFKQQRQFAAHARHQLGTPLTAIIGQIDVALGWPDSAEYYRATLGAVREQAQRLARLVGDLLFLARTDAQPTVSAAEPVDLGALLAAVVTQVEPLLSAAQIAKLCGGVWGGFAAPHPTTGEVWRAFGPPDLPSSHL